MNKKLKIEATGITLIALIITVIILLILAAITINGLVGENGIITRAKEAKISTELANYKEEVQLYKLTKTSENSNFVGETLTAGKTDLNYNTKAEEDGNIKTIIPDISDTYFEKLEVIKGELLINTQDKNEIRVAQRLGIEVNPYDIRDGVLWSSDGNLLLMDEKTGSLTIPDSVTAIGEGAFANLDGLRTIVIPPTVKRIEQNAFKNNTTLENVIIQTRDGEGVEYIGTSAFENCSNLQTINLPETITSIGERCFRFSKLDNVKLPSKLTSIETLTFSDCSNLKNIELSENLESLGEQALFNTSLTTLKFPSNLNSIGNGALNTLTLQDIDTSENNYFEFKNNALYSKDFKKLVVALSNITSINIENSVEEIQGYAFYNCNNLSNINMTDNIETIGYNALGNPNLKSITVSPNNKYLKTDENNNLYDINGEILYRLFDTGNVTIKDGVKNIKRGALLKNGTITGITLPESFVGDITKDEWSVFPSLDYLLLPKNVNTFNKQAYLDVKNIEVSSDNPYLQSINNEYIISEDGTILYWVKSSLTTVNIPESVETIGWNSLMHMDAETIILPDKVTTIQGNVVFDANVKRLDIQSKIESRNSLAFNGANNLTEVRIHKRNDGIPAGSPWSCPYGDRAIIWDE